jgi:hypothetical protein
MPIKVNPSVSDRVARRIVNVEAKATLFQVALLPKYQNQNNYLGGKYDRTTKNNQTRTRNLKA